MKAGGILQAMGIRRMSAMRGAPPRNPARVPHIEIVDGADSVIGSHIRSHADAKAAWTASPFRAFHSSSPARCFHQAPVHTAPTHER
jgi:hypothetical protein